MEKGKPEPRPMPPVDETAKAAEDEAMEETVEETDDGADDEAMDAEKPAPEPQPGFFRRMWFRMFG
jgi:hypothetical protein